MPRSVPPPLLLCTGKDCRDAKGYNAVHELALGVDGAMGVPCQGICEGPVVGVVVRGEVRWFGDVRGGKVRQQVLDTLAGGEVAKGLRGREARAHRGLIDHPRKSEPLHP